MRPSFAHFPATRHALLCGLAIAFAVAGCASLPPPTAELDAAQQAVARQYRVTGLPTLFIIDQQGMIRYHEAGYGGGLERALQRIFEELLAA